MIASKSRILVVEDEEDIRDLMVMHLEREGYQVESVVDGNQGLQALQQGNYQLAILDWMLPGVSGLELTRAMRAPERQADKRALPILMVTARMEAADIVLGLEAGADDYVTKPFEIPVFLARVRALLRRTKQASAGQTQSQVQLGELVIRPDAHEVTCSGEIVQLTPSEFKLLLSLVQNQGRVLTRDRLIELVQGAGVVVVDRAVDTHVFGLRKKLGNCSEWIETVRGVGYRIREK